MGAHARGEVDLHGADPVADGEPGDVRADGGDDAGQRAAQADRAGEAEDRPGGSAGDEQVDAVDGRGDHADAQVAGSGRGQGHLREGGGGGVGPGYERERHDFSVRSGVHPTFGALLSVGKKALVSGVGTRR
ncbi:hypothetical protein F4559_003290 [Saccharothrix violaceirubra]|uniref:Uncharacterized protein n=1 Tax=Saccharothrix violaceirubra TaxID=413306 RepID=A0A7W7T3Q2_9PSEU|nr:hypothetical protein [Saccharothrix violaceirubra]MBB4965931.1 hypothetical protein [Saccharothrix violaceirubra]